MIMKKNLSNLFLRGLTVNYKMLATRALTLLVTLLVTQSLFAQGTNLLEISGQVVDQEKKPISSVSVQIKGTIAGTVTSNDGTFTIRTRNKFPLTLIFSSVGFQPQEFEVNGISSKIAVELVTQTMLGKEVVVTASRVSENILKSPVAIEKLDIRAIRETPAPGFYDALENVKGVQMLT
jgi:hypothetical protein